MGAADLESAGALYRRRGVDEVLAQIGTQGPWDPAAQHGGAPAALLAGAIEATLPGHEMRVARVTLELLRPVPIGALRVEAELVRPGRRVQLVRAALYSEGQEVARALALRMRRGDGPSVGWARQGEPRRPGPDTAAGSAEGLGGAYGLESIELRAVRGVPTVPGPCLAWGRLRVDVVAGEPISPLQRALAAADFGNGISSVADWREWGFINPDLTVYLERDPVGEWIGLDAVSTLSADGTGLAESVLLDERGRFGRAVQSLLVMAR